MPDLSLEVVNRLIKAGSDETKILTVYENPLEKRVVLVSGEKVIEEHTIQKRPARKCTADDLDGLVKIFQDGVSDGKHKAIFVGDNEIEAYWDWPIPECVTMPMHYTHSYKMLMKLCASEAPLEVRDCYGLVVGPLAKNISPGLALQLSAFRVKKNTETNIDIQHCGATSRGGGSSIRVGYESPNKGTTFCDFDVDWEWTGRIYEADPEEITIPLRLEIVTDAGIGITFFPQGLYEAVQDSRRSVMGVLEKALTDRGISAIVALGMGA